MPQTKSLSYRLLKINPAHPWRKILRTAMYGGLGLLFILSARYSFEIKTETAEEAAKQAEQQQLGKEANFHVSALVQQAENLWADGNSHQAVQKLKLAEKTAHATNLKLVSELKIKMANAEVKSIMSDAISAANAGQLNIATEKVKNALGVPRATELKAAKQLQNHLTFIQDTERIKPVLLSLSDKEFAVLQNEGTIPDDFVSGYSGLDTQVAVLIHEALDEISVIREKQKKEQESKQVQQAAAKLADDAIGKKSVIKLDVVEQFGGGFAVTIEYKSEPAWNNAATRKGVMFKMRAVCKKAAASDGMAEIKEITICPIFEATDKTSFIGARVALPMVEIKKQDWSGLIYLPENLEKLAKEKGELWYHPALQ